MYLGGYVAQNIGIIGAVRVFLCKRVDHNLPAKLIVKIIEKPLVKPAQAAPHSKRNAEPQHRVQHTLRAL
jgi:hypothetical protein